jgi:glycosyltransferase involved in cell wall biosynthesis
MKDLGAQLSVSDLLSFPGVVENTKVFNMMAGADLVVVPSRPEFPEGTPLAMFGAIASRTPIVCSNHPMFQKLMVDGHNASGFRAGDYRDLGGGDETGPVGSGFVRCSIRKCSFDMGRLEGTG